MKTNHIFKALFLVSSVLITPSWSSPTQGLFEENVAAFQSARTRFEGDTTLIHLTQIHAQALDLLRALKETHACQEKDLVEKQGTHLWEKTQESYAQMRGEVSSAVTIPCPLCRMREGEEHGCSDEPLRGKPLPLAMAHFEEVKKSLYLLLLREKESLSDGADTLHQAWEILEKEQSVYDQLIAFYWRLEKILISLPETTHPHPLWDFWHTQGKGASYREACISTLHTRFFLFYFESVAQFREMALSYFVMRNQLKKSERRLAEKESCEISRL